MAAVTQRPIEFQGTNLGGMDQQKTKVYHPEKNRTTDEKVQQVNDLILDGNKRIDEQYSQLPNEQNGVKLTQKNERQVQIVKKLEIPNKNSSDSFFSYLSFSSFTGFLGSCLSSIKAQLFHNFPFISLRLTKLFGTNSLLDIEDDGNWNPNTDEGAHKIFNLSSDNKLDQETLEATKNELIKKLQKGKSKLPSPELMSVMEQMIKDVETAYTHLSNSLEKQKNTKNLIG